MNWELSWGSGIWFLIFALIFFGFEIYQWGRFSFVFILRLVWICLVAFILLNAFITKSKEWSEPLPIKVYVDRSDSISLVPSKKMKIENTLEALRKKSQERGLAIHVSSFAEGLREEPGDLQFGGYSTEFSHVKDEINASTDSQLIVMTDGNFPISESIAKPITWIDFSDSDEKDIWVKMPQPILTAFLKNRMEIPFQIGNKGFRGAVTASLWSGSEKVDEMEVDLAGESTEAKFSLFPEKMGESVYLIKIEPKSGEMSPVNNSIPFRIRTVRDKMRILHICGKPSVDLKAWRQFLIRQPDVDLVSFYILRSIEDNPDARDYELSLIPFPYEELFTTELEKFDLVILQNFDFNLYFQPFYLSSLANFVQRGGALLMVGGDMAFHKYMGSPLEPILPFSYGNRLGIFESKTESLRWTRNHPIIDGMKESFTSENWTARHLIQHREGATDLIQFVSGIPFLSFKQVEKGRVVSVNSDEFWKLQMHSTDSSPGFMKIARRLLQYLTFDPEMDDSKLQSGPWTVGKKVRISSVADKESSWMIRSMSGIENWQTEFPKDKSIEFQIPFAGLFQVFAKDLGRSEIYETLEKPWRQEWVELLNNPNQLKQLAKKYSGNVLRYEKIDEVFETKQLGQKLISSDRVSWMDTSVRGAWLYLIFVIFILGMDFYFRKRVDLDS